MLKKITFKFIAGIDANKQFTFDVTATPIILIGRDVLANVMLSNDDDTVSREHARVHIEGSGDNKYAMLEKLSKGRLVCNGQTTLADTKVPLQHDSKLELGDGGAVVVVTFDPIPIKPTRFVDTTAFMGAKPTRVVETINEATTKVNVDKPAAIGKETALHMIGEAKAQSDRKLLQFGVLSVAVMACIGGISYWMSSHQVDSVANNVTVAATASNSAAATIRQNWGNSTLFVETTWQLVDPVSKRIAHHKFKVFEQKKYPLYQQANDGSIHPVVTFDSTLGIGAFGGKHTGTAFVVTSDGFAMTSKQVAQGWSAPFAFQLPGIVQKSNGTIDLVDKLPSNQTNWLPTREQLFMDGSGQSIPQLIGQNSAVYVSFPKSSLRIPSRVSVVSESHNVGLLKVDAPQALQPVALSETDHQTIQAGSRLVQLGYIGHPARPYITDEVVGGTTSAATAVAHDVSVAEGMVSRIIPRNQGTSPGAISAGEIGDYVELNIAHSGSGNSGAPVFDSNGKVIGLFTTDLSNPAGTQAWVVPIRYGSALLHPSKK